MLRHNKREARDGYVIDALEQLKIDECMTFSPSPSSFEVNCDSTYTTALTSTSDSDIYM